MNLHFMEKRLHNLEKPASVLLLQACCEMIESGCEPGNTVLCEFFQHKCFVAAWFVYSFVYIDHLYCWNRCST